MLSAYRDLSDSQSNELDTHLETCPECRQVLAQQSIVGERLHLLPALEPDPDAYTRLMRSLAAEHTSYLQRSSESATPAVPAPDFLKPYIKEHIQETARLSRSSSLSRHTTRENSSIPSIAAFSTAETGPLPVLSPKRRRQRPRMNQFAILGLAAAFLLTMLTGGLVSLLLLASHSLSGSGSGVTASLSQLSQVTSLNATIQTSYPHIVSAVASNNHIYYSAYGDGEQQWMLEHVDNASKGATSTPLLSTASSQPLYVLAASQDWLVWLQLDTAKAVYQHPTQQKFNAITGYTRDWNLYALSLTNTSAENAPVTLASGVFDTSTVPAWVHTPVQGLSFAQADILLLTTIDAKGDSQLTRYLLNNTGKFTTSVLATASNGHILTSPTADSTGTYTFWSEEWLTADNMLHGNIWERLASSELTHGQHGWQPSITTNTFLFRSDEASFHPQVVNDTLFLLSTGSTDTSTATGQGTPGTTGTQGTSKVVSTPAPIKVTNPPAFSITTRLNPALYSTQVDETLPGMLLGLPLDNLIAEPKVMSNALAAAPQGGTSFLLWQDSTGYQMYDTYANLSVSVNNLPRNATFLAVNGDTTVWITNQSSNGASNGSSTSTGMTPITFSWFNWSSNR